MLDLTNNTLSVSNGNAVNLSGYLDNTDAQDLDLSGNTLSITNDATSVDLSGYLDNTDSQDLQLSGNTLSVTNDGTTVDLSGYLDNTDAQTLSISNGSLSITGGNSVDLSALQDGMGTDNQNLTAATINNNALTIAIENGNSVVVDLSSILVPLQDENTVQQTQIDNQQALISAQQTQINDLISRMETLEACACQVLGVEEHEDPQSRVNTPILYQNIPNPFNGTSSIKYYLPNQVSKATIVFSNTSGQVMSTVPLENRGDGELNINSDGLPSGTYFYSLYVENRKIDTKKMVIE